MMMEARAQATKITETHAVVSWAGQGEPIVLTLYAADGEVVSVPLSPVRALELAKQLIEPAVRSIKTSQWGEGWPG